jgi:hypothetical protein
MVTIAPSPLDSTVAELCSISAGFAIAQDQAPRGILLVLQDSSPQELLTLMARSNQRMRGWINAELDRRSMFSPVVHSRS